MSARPNHQSVSCRTLFAQASVREHRGQLKAALAGYEEVIHHAPNPIVASLGRARVLYRLGRSQQALAALDCMKRRWPQDVGVPALRAQVHLALGQLSEAKRQSLRAITLAPDNPRILASAAQLLSLREAPELERRIRRLVVGGCDDPFLLHGLFRIEDQLDNRAAAYCALERANKIWSLREPFSRTRARRLHLTLRSQFPQHRAASGPDHGAQPIFVVGMPRSGTTLVEAILSRHPDVEPLGESDALAQAVADGGALSQTYQNALPYVPAATRFYTDKTPLNFRFIGHIATEIPQARIIHVFRDPQATAWSLFRTAMAGGANRFSNSPAGILEMFRQYRLLMQFWEERFPDRIVRLDYEHLVRDPEVQTQRLISSLGLDWAQECLSPNETDMMVRTSSAEQVRRPIYRNSRVDWRRYEKWAGWLLGVA